MKPTALLPWLLFSLLSPCLAGTPPSAPELQLANKYRQDIPLHDYWISEKFDGVRAYWNGHQLLSRQGNRFRAPAWFTSVLPSTPLDGELWIGRGRFDELSAIVRRKTANTGDWRKVRYMVFDLPASNQTFDQRLAELSSIIANINAAHIQLVQQQRIADHDTLMKRLDLVVNAGGEGLMLHRGASLYQQRRSDDLLKLKKLFDAEAVVIEHIEGKGKFSGMMGSLLV